MFEEEYRETFSQVTASEAVYRRVRNMNKDTERRLRRVPRLVMITAMVLLLTACAVGFNALDMLEAAFGENGSVTVKEDRIVNYINEDGSEVYLGIGAMDRVPLDAELAAELVEPYVVEVNQSVTNEADGTVLTVEAYLIDTSTNTGILYMNLENPKGLPKYSLANTGMVLWDRNTVGANYIVGNPFGWSYCDEQRTTDTKLYLTTRFVVEADAFDLKIFFRDTDYKLSIPVSGFELEHMTLDDGSITLSPMGLYFCGKSQRWSPKEMKICYYDGTEYLVYGSATKKVDGKFRNVKTTNYYYALASSGEKQERSYCLNRIVDIDNVKSIIIDGKEYFPD